MARVCGAKTVGGVVRQTFGYPRKKERKKVIKLQDNNSLVALRATTLTREMQFREIASVVAPTRVALEK